LGLVLYVTDRRNDGTAHEKDGNRSEQGGDLDDGKRRLYKPLATLRNNNLGLVNDLMDHVTASVVQRHTGGDHSSFHQRRSPVEKAFRERRSDLKKKVGMQEKVINHPQSRLEDHVAHPIERDLSGVDEGLNELLESLFHEVLESHGVVVGPREAETRRLVLPRHSDEADESRAEQSEVETVDLEEDREDHRQGEHQRHGRCCCFDFD